MIIYEKLKEMMCNESCDEKLYKSLCAEYYAKYPYETKDLGENMSLVSKVIGQWWKPRFILDHTAQRGYEFMNLQEYLVTVTEDDIDWDSLKNLPEKAVRRAEILSFHYPSHIYRFENGVAEVSWQLNPDGRYFMDDDGYGMTCDDEITIYGYIDRQGKVLVKFQTITNYDRLRDLRAEAEKKAKAQTN